MVKPNEPKYIIPLRYRKMENLHIVFWLLKDLAWCLGFEVLGVAMIIPTFVISVVITWRTRYMVAELCHNAAISCWILANSYWMITEFMEIDEVVVWQDYTFKHVAVVPFVTGILLVAYYYLFYQWYYRRSTITMSKQGLQETNEGVVVQAE